MPVWVSIPFPLSGSGSRPLQMLSNPFTFLARSLSPRPPLLPMAAVSTTVTTDKSADSAPDQSSNNTPLPLQVSKRLEKFKTTIFTQMSMLAIKHGAINLGQGFPNFDGPEFVKEAAIQAIKDGKNQYARGFGVPDLNSAVAARFKKDTGLVVDPEKEVTVTSGCTEAIAATVLGLINPGDEVILFAPFYDSYEATLSMAGATIKSITLRPPNFSVPIDELKSAVSRKASARLTSDFFPFRFPESFERSNKNKCLTADLSTMALVSGGRSTLNPNAPLFIPASFRQVEDFSPQWWELVKTSKWFHDYWLNQHQEQEIFEGNDDEDEDIANLLPDTFDLGIADEFSSYLEECAQSAEQTADFGAKKEIFFPGLEIDTEALVKNLSLKSPKGGVRSPAEPAKYRQKPGQSMSPKCSPRRIQQPR